MMNILKSPGEPTMRTLPEDDTGGQLTRFSQTDNDTPPRSGMAMSGQNDITSKMDMEDEKI